MYYKYFSFRMCRIPPFIFGRSCNHNLLSEAALSKHLWCLSNPIVLDYRIYSLKLNLKVQRSPRRGPIPSHKDVFIQELWNSINQAIKFMKDSAYFCCGLSCGFLQPKSGSSVVKSTDQHTSVAGFILSPRPKPSSHCGIHRQKWVVDFFNQKRLISYKIHRPKVSSLVVEFMD
jgi:hypothetical protein